MTTEKALLVGGKKNENGLYLFFFLDFVLNYFRMCLFALFEIQSFKLLRRKPLLIFMTFNNLLSLLFPFFHYQSKTVVSMCSANER